MTPPEPSSAWVWDKFKEYSEGNDAVHGRMLRMITKLEHDNRALKMELNSLSQKLNNYAAQEGWY